jgi:hypothetical protein
MVNTVLSERSESKDDKSGVAQGMGTQADKTLPTG